MVMFKKKRGLFLCRSGALVPAAGMKISPSNNISPLVTQVLTYLEPDGHPFINGCFNWMMNKIFTWEMVGNHHLYPFKTGWICSSRCISFLKHPWCFNIVPDFQR